MVHLNGFSVNILAKYGYQYHRAEEVVQPDGSYLVPLPHETIYEIQLGNGNDTEADADIYIDGMFTIGMKVWAHHTVTVEHGEHDKRQFVFVAERSAIARESGVTPYEFENGLIEVIFTLRKRPKYEAVRQMAAPRYESLGATRMPSAMAAPVGSSAMFSQSAPQFEAGATVLGGRSWQEFTSVDPIPLNEIESETRITIRLVTAKSSCNSCPHGNSTPIPGRPEYY